MVMQRSLDLAARLAERSVLLLGPRMTGKSTLLRTQFPDALTIDLLDPRSLRELSAAPESLEDRVKAFIHERKSRMPVVVVDEVQKIPTLLDVTHRLIEMFPKARFVLTGSSARKLRRSSVNLLGGRARRAELFPITTHESGDYPYRKLLEWGGLPAVLTSNNPKDLLRDYVGLYLKEEVMAEGLTRSLEAFSRFLEAAALANGEQLSFSGVANDAGVPARTVRDHFQVLEDTLVGALLPAYRATTTRKAMAHAKFFFFDIGVANALTERWQPKLGTSEYGRALEHLVFCELRAAISYLRSEAKLSYWRSLSQMEVDFVLTQQRQPFLAIEVKASRNPSKKDLRGLIAFADDEPKVRRILVCEASARSETAEGIEIWPAREFFPALWAGQFI